jgi:hypothetical protein
MTDREKREEARQKLTAEAERRLAAMPKAKDITLDRSATSGTVRVTERRADDWQPPSAVEK